MATVGGVDCDFVRGVAEGLRERVTTWHTPGYVGVGAQTLGDNEGEFAFTAIKFDTLSNVNDWIFQLEQLQGTINEINDEVNTYGNLILEAVKKKELRAVIHDAQDKYRGVVELKGRVTGITL